MIVEYSKMFLKGIQKISDNTLKKQLLESINLFKNAYSLLEVPNIKKLKGHPEAYRFRLGKYRLGFYYNGKKIEMERFVKRENIYKLFP
ncbi:MAG: plasmid stabilization protein [Flavobacterium micromati]|nr:plasmid stabilization protein [Flavobacterium micromati]